MRLNALESSINGTLSSCKNKPKITISNIKGDLSVDVNIQLNKKMEPKSITFSGTTENKNALDIFLQEIMYKRNQEGYTLISKKEGPCHIPGLDYQEEFIYQKGNMYSIIASKSTEVDDLTEPQYTVGTLLGTPDHTFLGYRKKSVYNFSVELRDLYRMNDSEGKPIDF